MNYLTHLECSFCGEGYSAGRLQNLCPQCHKPLLCRYDWSKIKKEFTRDKLRDREANMWRYRELLPLQHRGNELTLGEGYTPLIHARRLGREVCMKNLYIKDEGLNPTGSFKARGLAVAVARARELGAKALSLPSAGNAAGAMSAYAALAGIPTFVFLPKDVPPPFIAECQAFGAKITLVDGLITDAGRLALQEAKKFDRFDLSTLKEPYRLEGKKTMGFELAEQMEWQLPDVIIYPTGGGTGLVGMWKAFDEMEALGWIGSQRPRMVTVQAEGCAPIVKAFREGREFADPWPNASTIADGLRVPAAVGDFLILRTLHHSNGTAITVTDAEMMTAAALFGKTQGLFVSPESAATLAALQKLLSSGWINEKETVVLFHTGSGYKYSHLWVK